MNLTFNFEHLKYFLDAVDLGSLRASSEKNHVSHSTVSQGIKRLEESFGVNLLVHKKRRFILSPEGKHLIASCMSVAKSVKMLEKDLQGLESEPTGEVSVASSQSILSAILLKEFAAVKSKYQNLSLNFEVGRTQEIKELVLSGKVEFGITIDDGQLFELMRTNLFSGKFVLVSKKKHKNIDAYGGFVMTKPRPETEFLYASYEKKYHKKLPVLYEVDSWRLIKDTLKTGDGIGFVPDFTVEKSDKLHRLDWQPNFSYNLVLVTRKGEALSRPAETYVNRLKTSLAE